MVNRVRYYATAVNYLFIVYTMVHTHTTYKTRLGTVRYNLKIEEIQKLQREVSITVLVFLY